MKLMTDKKYKGVLHISAMTDADQFQIDGEQKQELEKRSVLRVRGLLLKTSKPSTKKLTLVWWTLTSLFGFISRISSARCLLRYG